MGLEVAFLQALSSVPVPAAWCPLLFSCLLHKGTEQPGLQIKQPELRFRTASVLLSQVNDTGPRQRQLIVTCSTTELRAHCSLCIPKSCCELKASLEARTRAAVLGPLADPFTWKGRLTPKVFFFFFSFWLCFILFIYLFCKVSAIFLHFINQPCRIAPIVIGMMHFVPR